MEGRLGVGDRGHQYETTNMKDLESGVMVYDSPALKAASGVGCEPAMRWKDPSQMAAVLVRVLLL